MKYFSEDENYINAECEDCKKVVRIAKDNCFRQITGSDLLGMKTAMRCLCGRTFDSIQGAAVRQSTQTKSGSPIRIENFGNVEKKINKYILISVVIGCLIGLPAGFWGFTVGAFIGGFIGIGLFHLFASKETKQNFAMWKMSKAEQAKKDAENARFVRMKEERAQANLSIECPTCHSKSIERISTGKKLAYVVGFGILAPAFKKVRSQFECKNCGYKW